VCLGEGGFHRAKAKANPIMPRRRTEAGTPQAGRAPLIPPAGAGEDLALAVPAGGAEEVGMGL
jgi:hypothetical protein